jgi:CheY-like chemotaxis protein
MPLSYDSLQPVQSGKRQQMASSPPDKPVRIAFVENERDYREMLASWLSNWYRVECFSNGREFIEAVRNREPFDLIISDIHMPEMSGMELISWLRSDPELRETPAMAITAHLFQTDRQTALAAGFDEFLSKLADFDELRACICHMLAGEKV